MTDWRLCRDQAATSLPRARIDTFPPAGQLAWRLSRKVEYAVKFVSFPTSLHAYAALHTTPSVVVYAGPLPPSGVLWTASDVHAMPFQSRSRCALWLGTLSAGLSQPAATQNVADVQDIE